MSRNPFATNGAGSAGPDPNQRIGFMPTDREVVATRGVKLRTKTAAKKEQDAKERAEYQERFSENADKTIQYHQDKNARALEVVTAYLRMIEDRTLPRNRGSIANDVEMEIRQKLIQLALDMNNDENEEDNGKGSVVVLTAVSKALLLYRDRLNNLEYEIKNLKNELNKLSSAPQQQISNAIK